MRRALLVVWLWLLCSCVGATPPVVPGPEVVRYPVKHVRLANGLRVVLEQAPDFGRAGAVLLVGAGSSAERPERAGLAHLVEHLVFEAVPDGARTRRVGWEALGGDFNGGTSWDDTVYAVFVPQQNLPALLSSLAALLADPLDGVDAAAFEHERQIVLNELGRHRENGAAEQALEWLAASAFPPHDGYAHPLGGTRESLARLSLADAREFARRHYRPEASTLVVTAPSDPARLERLVNESFGVLPGGPRRAGPQPLELPKPPRAGGLDAIAVSDAPVPAPELWIGWAVPTLSGLAGDTPHLVGDMVGGTFWTNMYQRDDDISHVEAGVVGGERAGVFFLRVELKTGKNPEASARSVVTEMLRGLAERTYSYPAFDVYKRFLATERTYSEEHIVQRAINMAWSTQVHDDPLFLRGRAARMLRITRREVAAYYGRYLDRAGAHAVLVRPSRRELPTPTLAQEGVAREGAQAQAPDPRTAFPWLAPLRVSRAKRTRLASGLEVVVLPQSGSPFHSILLGFHAGATGYDTSAILAATQLALRPSGPHPALEGISYSHEVDQDSMRFVLRSTGADVRRSLRLLRSMTEHWQVTWPLPQFTSQRGVLEKLERTPESELRRELGRALFGSHSLGRRPRVADLLGVTPNQVHQLMSDMVHADNGALIIVGNVDADLALAAAATEFDRFHRAAAKRPLPAPPPLSRSAASQEDRAIVRHQPGSNQVALTFACVLPPGAEQTAAHRLFGAMLERHLFTELRLERAASYMVDGSWRSHRGGTQLFELRADADYGKLELALGALRSYLEPRSELTFGADALADARAHIARTFNLAHATTLELARTLFDHWNQGVPLELVDRNVERIWTTELDEVRSVSDYCRSNWVLGLRGDSARIRAAWGHAAAGGAQRPE